jgi:hypothetical protein
MQSKNTFLQSKMNKDADERLLPEGEYPHAENVRVIDSGDAHVGAIENVLGNEALTDFNLINAVTLGGCVDTSNQKIYFFTTSQTKDLVIEYDDFNKVTTVLLESTKPNSVLNFNPNYLITGVNKIINEDSDKDLLIWTDDYNEPRMINIERAKSYTVDGFIDDDINVIKKPPFYPPSITPFVSSDLASNNLKDKFLAFSYRYKYLDGGYSALSPFSYYNFTPSPFKVDYDILANDAMVNTYNSVVIDFNTGDKRVIGIDIVFKESNSNTVYLIQSFDKKKENWLNNTNVTYNFSNSKLYKALPETELSRLFDNVPRKAKAQDIVGNRIVYGNFLENYDIKDAKGEDIKIDYTVGLNTEVLTEIDVPTSVGSLPTFTDNLLTFDLTGVELKKDLTITFYIRLTERTYNSGSFNSSLSYTLKEDFATVADLKTSLDFINFIQVVATNIFTTTYNVPSPPAGSTVDSITPFNIETTIGDIITIKAPIVNYLITGVPSIVQSKWGFISTQTNVTYRLEASIGSLKSNRSNEVGIIYSDESGRSTTVLTSVDNTVNIPHANAITQNKFNVTINNPAPKWATRFKLAVKENKERYHEIYVSTFYQDGVYRWLKLEGDNKSKVKEGDILIIKTDLSGFVPTLTTVTALEVDIKPENFISTNAGGELAGRYVKIKPPVGININVSATPAYTVEGNARSSGGGFSMILKYFPQPITQGSRIQIALSNIKYGSNGGAYYYDKTFTVGADYDNIADWYAVEVVAVSPFTIIWGIDGGGLYAAVPNILNGNGQHDSYINGAITVTPNNGLIVLETTPDERLGDFYFESSEVFDIVDGLHQGNLQNQTSIVPAIVELDYYNCFAFGNGVESNAYKSGFTTNYLSMDLRPTATNLEPYKENRRFADLTYSGIYNNSTNINELNNFNLSTANFKDDIEKKYGGIQKIVARDTDLVVFQEDKVSKVLYGKAVLNNVDGTGNVGKIKDVLGQQITYDGEYGISQNPESFAFFGNRMYFTDVKRGTPLRLSNDGISEINDGMSNYFKDNYRDGLFVKKVGGYDPCNDQYIIVDDKINTYKDSTLGCGVNKYFKDFIGVADVFINFKGLSGNSTLNYTIASGTITIKQENEGVVTTVGTFNSTGSSPINVEITDSYNKRIIIESSSDATFIINSSCIVGENLKIVNIVLNDNDDVGLTLNSRFKWYDAISQSSYKTYNTPFSPSLITQFDAINGFKGVGNIPAEDATVIMESVKTVGDTGELISLDKMKYLITTNDYDESDIATILTDSTLLSTTINTNPSGDIVKSANFTLNTLPNEILYLIWDYRTAVEAVDDESEVAEYESANINVMSNDLGILTNYTPVIVTTPSSGTAIVNPDKTITYTSTGGTGTDTFTYELNNGDVTSNIATVNINIGAAMIISTYFSDVSTPTSNCDGAGIISYPLLLHYEKITESYPYFELGQVLYTDVELTTPFVGTDDWYHIDPSLSVRVNITGVIVEIDNCTI